MTQGVALTTLRYVALHCDASSWFTILHAHILQRLLNDLRTVPLIDHGELQGLGFELSSLCIMDCKDTQATLLINYGERQ